MPWAWSIARACLDMQTGNVLTWPFPQSSYEENAYYITAMLQVWRVWRLYYKKKNDWTEDDYKFYAPIHKAKQAALRGDGD